MYRRRRLPRESIAFGFDSFLDVIANVIGIIVRLILVAWVGARSYDSAMQWVDPAPAGVQTRPVPKASDDPLHAELHQTKRAIDATRSRLTAQLASLRGHEQRTQDAEEQLGRLTSRREEVEVQAGRLDASLKIQAAAASTASVKELKQRTEKLRASIELLRALPAAKKELKYHAPVSRAVRADEMFFECKGGRVTFIDLPAFLQEVRHGLEGKAEELKSQWQVTHATAPVGAFRLRYTLERQKSALESLGGGPAGSGFRYGLSEWVLEPIAARRGEPLDAALAEGSDFRRLVDRLDARITVVTFWVYPDSFELFRRLRDHLYEREIEVAGRPLPEDAPIAASRQGTASRGQ